MTSGLCGLAVCLVAVLGVFQLRLTTGQTFSPGPQQAAAAVLAEALKQRIRDRGRQTAREDRTGRLAGGRRRAFEPSEERGAVCG